jgi:TonB family protein
MKKIIPLMIFVLISLPVFSQEIVNLIMVGKKGITENIREASSFIVVKQYPGYLQRLDYNLGAPLQKVRSYSDSNLTILNGPYYEYSTDGAISLSGTYTSNVKEKDWSYYNDTGKVILTMQYENGVLIKTINPDTVKKEDPSTGLKEGEVEAAFKKGDGDWRKYLQQNLNVSLAAKTLKGGRIRVAFTVDTTGKCVDIYLRRSAQFMLDEEVIRVIQNSPPWKPAEKDGIKLKAYRIQPITLLKNTSSYFQ